MRCPNCNSPVEKDDEFCEICGARLMGKRNSKLPAVIISLAVVLAAAGGIGVWVFTGDYHPKGEDTTTDIAELNNGAEQETGSEKSQADTDESDSAEDRSTDRTDGTEDSGTSSGAAVTDGKTVDGTDQQEASGQTDAYDPSEGGIHRYEYVASDCSWSEAYQKCLDSGGYLARINSQEEYDYILSQIDQKQMQNIHFRIGGRRDANSQDYYWVDDTNTLYGEKINSGDYWCSGQWMSGEPSFSDGEIQENCLDIFYYQKEGRWVWNDVPDDILATVPEYAGKLGYICEYED